MPQSIEHIFFLLRYTSKSFPMASSSVILFSPLLKERRGTNNGIICRTRISEFLLMNIPK